MGHPDLWCGGGDVEQELLELAGDQHHVRAEGIDQLPRRVGVKLHAARGRRLRHPADRVGFLDAGQLHHAAAVVQRLADALEAVFVLHVHLA
jgi:hypothetical protein